MDRETDHEALNPQELRRHDSLVGSPVQFQDGSVFMVPAMPIGLVGDPLEKAISQLSEQEVIVQAMTAEQDQAVQKKLGEIETHVEGVTTDEVLAVHREWEEKIRAETKELMALQIRVVFLALSLNYNVDETILADVTTLRQVRQVSTILSGAPQADEMEEAMRIIRRAHRPAD